MDRTQGCNPLTPEGDETSISQSRPASSPNKSPSQEPGVAGLQNVPDTRAAKVEAARLLIEDPEYPSAEILRKISSLLADHLNRGRGSKSEI